jgi:putative ABC transport system ATP-binding protein
VETTLNSDQRCLSGVDNFRLDSKNGEAVMELLTDLHNQGATICMVTHDPRYSEFADRKIHLFDGRITTEEQELEPHT